MTDKSSMVFSDSELKPLSYALNRAKKVLKKEGKSKVIDLIRKQKIKIFAEKLQISESEECYRFSINKLPFLGKAPHFKNEEVQRKEKNKSTKRRGFAHPRFLGDDSTSEISSQSAERFKKYEESDRIAYEIAYSKNNDLIEKGKSCTRLRA